MQLISLPSSSWHLYYIWKTAEEKHYSNLCDLGGKKKLSSMTFKMTFQNEVSSQEENTQAARHRLLIIMLVRENCVLLGLLRVLAIT